MAETTDLVDQDLKPGGPPDSVINELAAQLGLSAADAGIAWDAVRDVREARAAGGDAGAEQTGVAVAERLDVGDLIDLFDGGKKPDLADMAKDELVKAVAKKLGVDPEKAGPIVDTILAMLDKPAPKRRRKTTKKKPKKKTTGKRPSASGSGRKRPKAKPSSTAKPAPKKKRPAAKPATSTGAKPAPRKQRPAAKPKPASSSTSTKPRKRPATRSSVDTAGTGQQ
jgi:hypothetical protein